MSAPKPLTEAERIELLEAQVATLSTQIENVAKFLALGIAGQMQEQLAAAGAPAGMQEQLRAALQADAAQS